MYPRLRAFFLPIFLFLFSFAQAQNSSRLTGKVLNEKNEPLAGVSVQITGGGGTTTDVGGRFSLNLTPGKKYELQFSAIGYASKTIIYSEVVP